MNVKVINTSKSLQLPEYATSNSSGMDLRASWDSLKDGKYVPIKMYSATYTTEHDFHNELDTPLILKPGDRALIPTGLMIAVPEGYEAQVRPRSGSALKEGITVLNAPGTVDASYRGMVGVILINSGFNNVTIKHGDRIAQLVLQKVELIEWVQIDRFTAEDASERGEGGFGHTGKK